MNLEYVLPDEIEKRSFEIIESELGDRIIPEDIKPIVMRVIHTTADFEYCDNLCFSPDAVETAARQKNVPGYDHQEKYSPTSVRPLYSLRMQISIEPSDCSFSLSITYRILFFQAAFYTFPVLLCSSYTKHH